MWWLAWLPADSEVLFAQRGLWAEYRWHVLGGFGLFAAQGTLIAALLLQRRRRREAEAAAQRHLTQIAHLDRVASMGHLTSSMAHELNQPLTAILANAQAARRLLGQSDPNVDEVRQCLADIVSDDKRASAVIQRIRQLVKRTDVARVPIALNDLVVTTIRLVANDALLHAVTIEFLPVPALPTLHGDPVQIQQVILNLLSNAVTAAAHAGDATRAVTVWTSVLSSHEIELAVYDSGKGIAESDLEQIFEPFFTTRPDGLGMGLTISRTIVETHGGRLLVENAPAGGATFRAHLPTNHAGRM